MNIEIVREYCLCKPGATEDCAFGPDGVLFRICDKIFAYIDLNRPDRVVVKCDPDKSITLRDTYHGIHTAWHWNKKHWIEIHFETDVPDENVLQLIDESYQLVANKLPKKKLVTFPELPQGWHYQHLFTTDTVMNFLKEGFEEESHLPYHLVTVDHQTAGRGQQNHHWEDEDGANLLVGIKMREMNLPIEWHFRLTQVYSITIAQALHSYLGTRVRIKWPNDIYVDNKKIGGMIFENKVAGKLITESIVGFGINVNQTTFHSDAPNPTSLHLEIGHEVDRAAILRKIIKPLPAMLETIQHESPSHFEKAYTQWLYGRDKLHVYRDSEGEFQAKVFVVADDGRLTLKDKKGNLKFYYFNEVQLIR